MKKSSSEGQRGSTVGMVMFSLVVAAVIAALSRGCDEEPAPAQPQASLPAAAPAATPALPPPPAAIEQAAVVAPTPAVPPGVTALVVHNPCDRPLLMAVSAADANGKRLNEGFFQVAPGARMAPTTRSGPIYLYDKTIYYYTETAASEPVEVGRSDQTVGDRQVGMKQVDLDPPALAAITLECPGMTSGRP